jgi:hypothetical protein
MRRPMSDSKNVRLVCGSGAALSSQFKLDQGACLRLFMCAAVLDGATYIHVSHEIVAQIWVLPWSWGLIGRKWAASRALWRVWRASDVRSWSWAKARVGWMALKQTSKPPINHIHPLEDVRSPNDLLNRWFRGQSLLTCPLTTGKLALIDLLVSSSPDTFSIWQDLSRYVPSWQTQEFSGKRLIRGLFFFFFWMIGWQSNMPMYALDFRFFWDQQQMAH